MEHQVSGGRNLTDLKLCTLFVLQAGTETPVIHCGLITVLRGTLLLFTVLGSTVELLMKDCPSWQPENGLKRVA